MPPHFTEEFLPQSPELVPLSAWLSVVIVLIVTGLLLVKRKRSQN